MKHRLLVGVLAGFLALSVRAEDSAPATIRFSVFGARAECLGWTKGRLDAKAARRKNDFDIVSALTEQWLLGYLSGVVTAEHAAENPLAIVDADLIFDWMDQYCKKNPTSNIGRGGDQLLGELLKLRRESPKAQP